jgi:glutamate dehydrogenase (NAD(P)+)
MAPDELVSVDCDIWIPAARPDVITEGNAARLRARMLLEGANIPATEQAERSLFERGVLVVPDFIANAGGVICAAAEYRGAGRVAAFQEVDEKIRHNAAAMLDKARADRVPPRQAAAALAEQRVRAAMALRRWGWGGA